MGGVWALGLWLVVGCGDSSDGSASMSNSESQSGGETSTSSGGSTEPTGTDSMSASTTVTEGGMSDSLSGTTGAEGGISDSLSGTNSSGVESESMSGTSDQTTGMVSGGGETTGTSTGEPVDCASFNNEAECTQAGCLAFLGRLFVSNDADLCLDPPSFLGCAEPAPCAAQETYVCKGMNKYLLPIACLPEGYMNCAMPPDAGGDGWPDCN
jgi:hypothetical protein